MLNYLRTNTFVEPKSAQDRAELLLEAEYYQIKSLIKQLKGETSTNMVVVEKLLFDPNLHHPQVVISEGGLKANHPGTCAKYLYAKVNNISWQNGRHYWEITLETPSRNTSLTYQQNIGNILIIFKVVTHQWVLSHLRGI